MSDSQPGPMPLSEGDTVVVTGAAKRLGRAISLALADSPGLNVVVHFGRSKSAASEVAADVEKLGRNCVTVSADLRDPMAAAESTFAAASGLGPVRALINCAAVFDERDLENITTSHWHDQFTVNALAPLLMSQQFARQLPQSISGHIINLLDWRATRPPKTHAVYTASKAALASLTKSLAQQLAPRIQVNAIAPGAMLPPPGQEEWHSERAADAIPLKRTGRPSDICQAVQFLLQSTFVTGEILHVTGGEQL